MIHDKGEDLSLSAKLFWKQYKRLDFVMTQMNDSRSHMMFSTSDKGKFELIRELIRENYSMKYRKMKVKEIECRLRAIFKAIQDVPKLDVKISRFIRSLAGLETTVSSAKIGTAISMYRFLVSTCRHYGGLVEQMDEINTEIADFSSPFSLSVAIRMLRTQLDAVTFATQTMLDRLVIVMTRLDVNISQQPLVQRLDTLCSAAEWELAAVASRVSCLGKLASEAKCCIMSLRSLTGEQWTMRPLHYHSKNCRDLIDLLDAYINLATANHGRSDKTTSETDIVRGVRGWSHHITHITSLTQTQNTGTHSCNTEKIHASRRVLCRG